VTNFPLPEVTDLSRPYWDGLAEGELRFQRCSQCQKAWLPPREQCPRCLSDRWEWTGASGRGRIISWVVYRQSMHPAFTGRLPYNVAVVELDEGPRLITNIDAEEDRLGIEVPVVLAIAVEEGFALARFALDDAACGAQIRN
jgi:uncharacterized OB-fold protein